MEFMKGEKWGVSNHLISEFVRQGGMSAPDESAAVALETELEVDL